jgi:hypothetical protein
MNLQTLKYIVLFIVVLIFFSCDHKESKQSKKQYQQTLVFEDVGTDNWRKNWTLDGLMATVTNTKAGMEFKAGNTYMNDSCHAVLWTRQVFKGNIKINYEYTRTDTVTRCVTILYFLASGKGTADFPKDISEWKSKRTVPKMSLYFEHMHAYHISYAAFSAKEYSKDKDYIRLRKYDPKKQGLEGTDILPDYFNTQLFKPYTTYLIEVVKSNDYITMSIKNKRDISDTLHCKWNIKNTPNLTSGSIGFRHMFTRSAIYKNIQVWRID